jgi:hypothetical protein
MTGQGRSRRIDAPEAIVAPLSLGDLGRHQQQMAEDLAMFTGTHEQPLKT